jgi:hypothetical protein
MSEEILNERIMEETAATFPVDKPEWPHTNILDRHTACIVLMGKLGASRCDDKTMTASDHYAYHLAVKALKREILAARLELAALLSSHPNTIRSRHI